MYFTTKAALQWPALQGVAGAELLQGSAPGGNTSKQNRAYHTQTKKEFFSFDPGSQKFG